MWLNPKSNLPAAVGHLLVSITRSVKKCFVTLVGALACHTLLLLTSYAILNKIWLPLYDRMFIDLVFTSMYLWIMKAFDTTSLLLSRFMSSLPVCSITMHFVALLWNILTVFCRTIYTRYQNEQAWFGKTSMHLRAVRETLKTFIFGKHLYRVSQDIWIEILTCCAGRNYHTWIKLDYFYIIANRHRMPVAFGFHTIYENIRILWHFHEY